MRHASPRAGRGARRPRRPRGLARASATSATCSSPSVADGAPFERAMLARERWLELIERARLHVVRAGTLIVARAPDEVALLELVAGDAVRAARHAHTRRGRRAGTDPYRHRERRIPQLTRSAGRPALGCRWAGRTARGRSPGAQVLWGTQVHDVEPGFVHATGASVRAPAIIVCPGPDYRSLPSRRCVARTRAAGTIMHAADALLAAGAGRSALRHGAGDGAQPRALPRVRHTSAGRGAAAAAPGSAAGAARARDPSAGHAAPRWRPDRW